jgi:hypothetical protein
MAPSPIYLGLELNLHVIKSQNSYALCLLTSISSYLDAGNIAGTESLSWTMASLVSGVSFLKI